MKKIFMTVLGLFVFFGILLFAFTNTNTITFDLFYKSLDVEFILPNGDILKIKEADSWEVSIDYSYSVKRNNVTIVPETAFYYRDPDDDQLEFEIIYSKDKKMVAIIRKIDPKVIYILYDMDTEISIPRGLDTDQLEESVIRKEKMLEKFNNGKSDYQLGDI